MSTTLPSIENPVWISGSKIRKVYGVSTTTLHRHEEKGNIKTLRPEGSNRLYLASDVDKLFQAYDEDGKPIYKDRRKIIYCRVSSSKQKEDLERQCSTLKQLYPDHELIKDIGSGVNFKRKGFLSVLESVYRKDVSEVVVLYKDRFTRFASELVSWIFQKGECKLLVHSTSDRNEGDRDAELAEDLIAVVTHFTAKHHGERAAQNRKRRKELSEKTSKEEVKEREDRRRKKRRKEPYRTEGTELSSDEDEENQNTSDSETEGNIEKMDGNGKMDL